MKKVYIAVASGVSSAQLRLYEDEGASASLLWSKSRTLNYGVAFDCDGHVYVTGNRSSNVTTRAYDLDGEILWSADHTIANNAIAVGCQGGVLTSGKQASGTGTPTHRYYDTNGNLSWSANHGSELFGAHVDGSGNAFIAGNRVSSVTNRKYNSSGTPQTPSLDHGNTSRAIITDASGNIYTAGSRTTGNLTTRKYNSSGTLQWSADHGAQCNGIAVDGDGNVYTVGVRTSDITTRKYASDGTEVTTGNWPIDHGANVQSCVFLNGHLYTTGTRTGDITTRKYAPDGTLVWSVDVGGTTYGVAGYIQQSADPPGLALPIRLAIPLATLTAGNTTSSPGLALPFALRVPLLITDRYDAAPGLALNLALRLPTLRLEHPRAFQFQEVYALYLGGVLLPFSSITCRRGRGGLSLNVIIPSASAELLAAVAANEGGNLRVLRGPRFPDGSVQLDGLWSATLDAWSFRVGAETGSITLQASAPTVIQAARSRTLREVSYVNSGQGLRRVRCRIDTYLQPGDVALLGAGQTLIADNLTYSIQSGSVFMEVQGF